MKTLRRRRIVVPGVLAVLSAIAATSAGATSGRHAAGPNLAYARAQIQAFSAIPKFIPPGPAFSTAKARGKTVFNIPFSSSIPFVITIDQSMQRIAKRFGIKFVEYANQGQPVQWAQGIQQAINQKADLIELNGAPNPAVLQPQLKQARAAGVAVTATHWDDVSLPPPPNVTALIDPRYRQAGRLEADWVIQDTKGKADVLVVNSADIVPSNGIVAAIKDEFARYCGSSCKVSVINVPGNAWPKIQNQVQTSLVNDPAINYVIPLYDSMSQWVVPAIQAAGRVGKVHIATYNGTPFVMKMLQTGNIVSMEVGENLDWLGWASMDQIMRVLTGQKPVKDEHTALRVFTKANIDQAGTPPAVDVGYGKAYIQGYNKLWLK